MPFAAQLSGCCCSWSVVKLCLFVTPRIVARQASLSFTIPRSMLKLMSIESVMPSNHLILCRPLLLLPSIFPGIRAFSNELALCIRWPKYWSFSFTISPSNGYLRMISFRLIWSPCCLRDSQESSPTPQFKSICSLVLSLLYHPTLTSIQEYWKNHSFDFIDLCFLMCYLDLSYFFFPKEQASFNLMAAVTVHSDFGVQENKICHCFHSFPFYLPWSDGTGGHNLSFLNVEV